MCQHLSSIAEQIRANHQLIRVNIEQTDVHKEGFSVNLSAQQPNNKAQTGLTFFNRLGKMFSQSNATGTPALNSAGNTAQP